MIRLLLLSILVILSSVCYADIPQDVLSKLNSESVDERLDACLLLGKLGNPEAIPFLKEELRDSSMLVRHSAANALARIGGEEVNSIFRELIASNSTEKKRIGLAGLALTGDPASIESVVGELDNPDWQVRWSAVFVLGQWGYRPALEKLSEIAKNDSYIDSTGVYLVRKAAEDACKKILCSIEWYKNLKDAKLLSEKLGKPVWTYWYIEDNNLCRQTEEDILFSAEVSDLSQNFICVKLDGVKNPDSVLQYDVNAVPCIIILDKNDNEIDRMVGLISREDLINRLKKALDNKGTPKQWKELLAQNPKDVESSWHLAEWYMDNGRIEDAVPFLENVVRYDDKNQSGYTDNALFALGYTLGAMGKYKKAVELTEELKSRYPDFKDMDKALYCLGLNYLSLNKPDSAKKIFTELIKVYPESKVVKPTKEILEKL